MSPSRDEGMPDYNLSQELFEAELSPLDTSAAAPESMIGNLLVLSHSGSI